MNVRMWWMPAGRYGRQRIGNGRVQHGLVHGAVAANVPRAILGAGRLVSPSNGLRSPANGCSARMRRYSQTEDREPAPRGPAAGLEGVHIHDLRHFFAWRALTLGKRRRMIGKLLGRSKKETRPRGMRIWRGIRSRGHRRVSHTPSARTFSSVGLRTVACRLDRPSGIRCGYTEQSARLSEHSVSHRGMKGVGMRNTTRFDGSAARRRKPSETGIMVSPTPTRAERWQSARDCTWSAGSLGHYKDIT